MSNQSKKTMLYLTYKDGYVEVEIEEDGIRKLYAKYKNVENKGEHDFCVEVANKVEAEIGKDVQWTSVKTESKKKQWSTTKIVVVVLVSTFAAIGLVFVGMVAYAYFQIDKNASTSSYTSKTTTSSTSSSTSSSSSSRMSPEEYEQLYKETNPFEFGDGYDDTNSSYNRYVGTITNTSNTTHYFIKVRGSFMDENDNTIDTAWTYACGQEGLMPGESTKFTLSVNRDTRIAKISYNVIDYQ